MSDSGVFIIAHKGASGQEPENTLAAFRGSLELGADMIGVDGIFTNYPDVMDR